MPARFRFSCAANPNISRSFASKRSASKMISLDISTRPSSSLPFRIASVNLALRASACSFAFSASISAVTSAFFSAGASSMFLQRPANLRVAWVIDRSRNDGETITNMRHLAFPPSESARTRVSIELRYGTWWSLAERDIITSWSAASDLLMPMASLSAFPSAPDCWTFSDPARSTRNIFPAARSPERLSTVRTPMRMRRWERDECSLRLVAPVARTSCPYSTSESPRESPSTLCSERPSTCTLPRLSEVIFSCPASRAEFPGESSSHPTLCCAPGASRSLTVSL
mmetsp:Transcript_18937/g.45652  ORF Transcript_18937/g.45652 Transcript_18937/m.45652 type:complete len:285 (+) Transcript_18937:627-1481(+)